VSQLLEGGSVDDRLREVSGHKLTIAEALSCGLPVITTDIAPCNEFVHDGHNGWLIPVVATHRRRDDYYWPEVECDPVALARAMQYCVDNVGSLPIWRKNARQYAEQHLDWRRNAAMLVNEVSALLAGTPSTVPPRVLYEITNTYSDHPSLAWRIRRRVRRLVGTVTDARARWTGTS
jgi:hypothetical protein